MSFDKTFMSYAVLIHFILYWVFVIVNTMVLSYNDFEKVPSKNKSSFFLDMMSYTIGVHTGSSPVPSPKDDASSVIKRIYFIQTMLVYLLNIAIVYKIMNPGSMFAQIINNIN